MCIYITLAIEMFDILLATTSKFDYVVKTALFLSDKNDEPKKIQAISSEIWY